MKSVYILWGHNHVRGLSGEISGHPHSMLYVKSELLNTNADWMSMFSLLTHAKTWLNYNCTF